MYIYTYAVLLESLPLPQPIIISHADTDSLSGVFTCMHTYMYMYFINNYVHICKLMYKYTLYVCTHL